ncbi:hypothetical protein JOL79_01350 [Microbispora sp. RL4-1S]|uniref:Solute-binding protein family 5 domain-containing protein n=1 Tax=Microbispora oryzae TaxID=2806554 RepID=A0A940WD95_9ACTN|nr:hypothetical protein [Microbispora oryzae]MBP2702443.1 hypothetical protein [Microbispora oryzae]
MPKPVKTLAEFTRAQAGGRLPGLFRAGWSLDFPYVENALGHYASGALFNFSVYRAPKFDALLKSADRQVSASGATRLYQRAESLLVQDLPAIPLWFTREMAGYSSRIASAKLTPSGWLDASSVRIA